MVIGFVLAIIRRLQELKRSKESRKAPLNETAELSEV
jgi:hypothetical protein